MSAKGIKPGVILKLVNYLRDLVRRLYGRLKVTDQELAGAVAEMLRVGEKRLEQQVKNATLKADKAKGVANEPDTIKNLRERIAEYDEITIVPGAILADDPKGAGFRLVRELAERLGRRVIFYKPGTGEGSLLLPQGAVTGGNKEIYINSAAHDPHLLILGHELAHSIRNSDEKLYKRLAATIQPLLQNYTPYKACAAAAMRTAVG